MAQHTQSVIRISRVGIRTTTYDNSRKAIDEHLDGYSKQGWYVVGYHIVFDVDHNVEEHNFIWRRD